MRKIIKVIMMCAISILLSLLLFYKMTTDGLTTKIEGFSVLQVTSGSMKPNLQIGDIIIIKECEDYEVGDIITYNENNQYLVTHRIIEKKENNFVTKGDNNNTPDTQKVTKEKIEGKVIRNSKLLKWIYNHWIVAVLAIILILLIW